MIYCFILGFTCPPSLPLQAPNFVFLNLENKSNIDFWNCYKKVTRSKFSYLIFFIQIWNMNVGSFAWSKKLLLIRINHYRFQYFLRIFLLYLMCNFSLKATEKFQEKYEGQWEIESTQIKKEKEGKYERKVCKIWQQKISNWF